MFDVGFQEIVLIGVIALLIIGPERLPSVARSVGLWVGKMQRFVAGVKSDIHNELKTDELRNLLSNQEDQIRELKDMVNETRTDLERTAKTASDSISQGMDQAVDQVKDAADTARENSSKMEAIAKAAGVNMLSDKPAIGDASADDAAVSESPVAIGNADKDAAPETSNQSSSKSA